ncbi:MAG: hypothetical protein KUL78_06130 [Flavobacterium sp.]|jgi:hypothetical protein|nr:hypothetical protein [Flavobacterium sp.]
MKVYSKSLFSLFFLFLMSAEIFANEPPAPPDDNDPLDLPLDDLVFLFGATSILYAFFVLRADEEKS